MADADDVGRAWRSLLPAEAIEFPADFVWGVASSAFQAEGGDVPNDWVEAARAGRVPPNPGNGFWQRAAEDFALVAALGIRHYRLSIEWSRVQPARDRFDAAAIERYRAMCDAAVAAGLTPWVNFFHFTHPSWFAADGGFLAPSGPATFLRYVEHVGRALAGHARHFHVANESMVYVLASYLLGTNPPFVADRERAFDMTHHVLAMHAAAYQLLKAIDPANTVATIEVYLDPRPLDPADPGQQAAAKSFDEWYHGVLLEALATGWVRLPHRDPVEISGLRGALDVYGFNYYSSIGFGPSGPTTYSDLSAPPVDSMGRAVFPRGMEDGLLRVAAALPGVPLLVTENGCPTTDEGFRVRYLAAHLAALDRARRRGAPVRGYFHWTAVDNYEWQHGFSDARFGLIGFDPTTRDRRPKASADWLRRVITTRKLVPSGIG
jgi:beta-glucosidase